MKAWSVLQKAYERYEKSWEKLDEAFTMVLLVEPDDAEQGHVTLEQGDFFHQFEQATTELTKAANIRKAEQQRSAEERRADSGAGGASRRVTAKSDATLKPPSPSQRP